MTTLSLAHKLGMVPHHSYLRQLARQHGLVTEQDLIREAVARGCFHFLQSDRPPEKSVSEELFSNEQLALAMLTVANPYDPWLLRVGAMMLSHPDNDAAELARYARYERSQCVVRAIAEAGLKYEPHHEFWPRLLADLPQGVAPRNGVLPHHSRFVSIPGKTGPGTMGKPVWLRPARPASLGYAA